MPDESDIYRSAKVVIDQYGDDAEIQAVMMADEMAEKGDVVGYTMWKLILKAIDELRGGKAPPDATVH